jgi:hypothetical protein
MEDIKHGLCASGTVPGTMIAPHGFKESESLPSAEQRLHQTMRRIFAYDLSVLVEPFVSPRLTPVFESLISEQ